MFFSNYARKVTMLILAAYLSPAMSGYTVDRIKPTSNIEVISGVEATEAVGKNELKQ